MLQGLGVAIGLPALDSMLPSSLSAAEAAAKTWPTRSLFLFIPNGAHLDDWTPTKVGKNYEMRPILEPVAGFRDRMNILTGLAMKAGEAQGDGPGDHARSSATFLTGVHPVKTAGSDIKVGRSIDQVIAEHVGKETRFRSLELGIERGLNAGGCDSGYSCAYSSNISWRSESTPSAKEVNPKAVFDRLFASGSTKESQAARARREQSRKSVLDFVMQDIKSLEGNVGAQDRRKLDEYATSIREIENRLSHFAEADHTAPKLDLPEKEPTGFADHVRLMGDLAVLAMQTDQTRVISLMFGNEGSNRPYKELGISEGHHSLSHHQQNKKKIEQVAVINLHHVKQLAYILEKMDAVKEGDGTLLDHSLVVYGSGIGDGNRHNHDDLPILTFGTANGRVYAGQHIKYPGKTPLCNLYLSMLHVNGIDYKSFADSRAPLKGILKERS